MCPTVLAPLHIWDGCLQKSEEHAGPPGTGALMWVWDTELTEERKSLLITDPSLQPPLPSPRPSQEHSILLGQSSVSFEFKQVVTSRLEFEIFCWKIEEGHISQIDFQLCQSCQAASANQNWKSVDVKVKGLFSVMFSKKNLKCVGPSDFVPSVVLFTSWGKSLNLCVNLVYLWINGNICKIALRLKIIDIKCPFSFLSPSLGSIISPYF